MLSREQLRWGIGVIIAVPVIAGFILVIRIGGAVSSIPVAVGKSVNVEGFARGLVNRAVDVGVAYEFRDDLLLIMEEHVHQSDLDPDEYDRWGLLRQIDEHREEAIDDLQTGESVLSIGGAIVSIALGAWFDIRYVGIGLTVVLLFFSILVVLRVVVTDLLSYRSREVRNDSIESLLLKRGWNETQINHGTSLVLASILLTASSSEWGYELGLRIVEQFGRASNPRDNNRYSAESLSDEQL